MSSTVVQNQTILHVSAALLSRTNGAARTDARPRRYLHSSAPPWLEAPSTFPATEHT